MTTGSGGGGPAGSAIGPSDSHAPNVGTAPVAGTVAAFICSVLPMRAKSSSWPGASEVAAGDEASGVASTSAHCFPGGLGCWWYWRPLSVPRA